MERSIAGMYIFGCSFLHDFVVSQILNLFRIILWGEGPSMIDFMLR
jgi:hypothetical protein